MSFKVVTDSTCNIPASICKERDITIVPFFFYPTDDINNTMTCEDVDLFDAKEYYDTIRNGKMYNTSQVAPQTYYDVISPLAEAGNDVIVITMSSGISGTFNSGMIAKSMLEEEFPDRKFFILDSLGAGYGQGLLALKASEYNENGMDAETAYEALLTDVKKLYQLFTVDSLKHLQRTGRLSNVAAIVGSVLQIKPLLIGSEEGKIISTDKIRGQAKAIKAMADKYNELAVNPGEQVITIAHADNQEGMDALIKLINETNPPKQILTAAFEPATGSHVGPGALAIFFFGDEDVRKQKNALTSITSKISTLKDKITKDSTHSGTSEKNEK